MNDGFSAWRVGAPYYVPLLLAGVGLPTVGWGTWIAWIGAGSLAAGLFTLYFFRDPQRAIPDGETEIVSPADGTIVAIESFEDSPHYDGPCQRVSIFLSVFNVHVNRAPFAGTVTNIAYAKGRYINAMSPESSKVNESNAIWIDTPAGPMTVRQISGAVARRIVSLPKNGDAVSKGDKIGMIKFGSRTELYLPETVDIAVSLKQKVRGGATIIARAVPDAE